MKKLLMRVPYKMKYGSIHVPEKYKQGFHEKMLEMNIRRERALAYFLIVFVLIILSIILFVEDPITVNKYVSRASLNIHCFLMMTPVLFLLLTNKAEIADGQRMRRLAVYHRAVVGFVLVLCSLIAVNNIMINQRPFTYIVAIFSIASLVILNNIERHLYFITSFAVFILGAINLEKEMAQALGNILFILPLIALAMMISTINYRTFVSSYINHVLVQEKNNQLDRLYRMTEEMLKERTEQLSRIQEMEQMRTAFFANISHELRTPLNLIFSSEQLLDKICGSGNLDSHAGAINKYNSIIKQNCYRLTRLIGNLIDITKIDANYYKPCFQNIDIVKVVEDITMSVADYIEDKDIKLIFDTEYEEKILAVDVYQVERILLNLLSNAVKFTTAGGEIFVRLSQSGDKAVISIKDNGIGVPDAMKDKIFDRFFQVDKTITRSREGSGIGLSIVKELVQMHEGSIHLISEEGKGSEFIVELPIRVLSQDALDECACETEDKVEKIKIEFSDIYN